MFVTSFYSYKGGVGRSVALLNVAWELAIRGCRVALLDLDLEAPGLQHAPLKKDPTVRPWGWTVPNPVCGFRTLVRDYLGGKPAASLRDQIKDYLVDGLGPDGRIALLAARGNLDHDYLAFVDRFSWIDFYLSESRPGKVLTAAIVIGLAKLGFDYLLVDGRTGLTDVRGATLVDMPDLVVLMTNLSDQSVHGIREQLEHVQQVNANGQPNASRRPKRETVPIKTLVVGSPLPVGELARRHERLQWIRNQLQKPLDVEIDYLPLLALEESHQIVAQMITDYGAVHARASGPYHALADAIVRQNPLASDNLVAQADELLKLGRWREALAHYDEVVDRAGAGATEATTPLAQRALSGRVWAQLRAITHVDTALRSLEDSNAAVPPDLTQRRLAAAWALIVAERFETAADQALRAFNAERQGSSSSDDFLVALSGFAAGQALSLALRFQQAAQVLHETHRACEKSGSQPLLHTLALAEYGRIMALIGPAEDGHVALRQARALGVRGSYVQARVGLASGELLAESGRGVAAIAELQRARTRFLDQAEADDVGVIETMLSEADIAPRVDGDALASLNERAHSLNMSQMSFRIRLLQAERVIAAGHLADADVCLLAFNLPDNDEGIKSRGEKLLRAELLLTHCRRLLIADDSGRTRPLLERARVLLTAATDEFSDIERVPLFHDYELLSALLTPDGRLAPRADDLEQRGLFTRALQARLVDAVVTGEVDALTRTSTKIERPSEWLWNLPIAFLARTATFGVRLRAVCDQSGCPWPVPNDAS